MAACRETIQVDEVGCVCERTGAHSLHSCRCGYTWTRYADGTYDLGGRLKSETVEIKEPSGQ